MRTNFWRVTEAILLIFAFLVGCVGFLSVQAAEKVRQGLGQEIGLLNALLPVLPVMVIFVVIHFVLSIRKLTIEEFVLPITCLLVMIGVTMIWRLRGREGYDQQILRGFIPGGILIILLLFQPYLLERMRRWAFGVGITGLVLLFLTGLVGVRDETGARLALKLGPLPAIQTSEIIKLCLIIFLSWYIEREGRAAEGRAHILLWFRLPALRYLLPAAAFVGAATLALVAMSDYGAVLILAGLFIVMLYTGFETRIFLTISALGLSMAGIVGLVLSKLWTLPESIQYRILAFQNPWSKQLMPNGLTIAEGPGYQIQQSLYAIIAGGVTGTGLGMGSPTFIPLAHSDFIFAAIMEEMGSAVGFAILFLYIILILRIIRMAILVPRPQIFERLLLTGIGVHFFTQVFIMVGGTFNLIPLTGVTLPFLSQGGIALMVNLFEIGLVLSLGQRVQRDTSDEQVFQ